MSGKELDKNNRDSKNSGVLKTIGEGILSSLKNEEHAKYYRAFLVAALGSIDWIGGVYSALIALQAESEQGKLNDMQKIWLSEHKDRLVNLESTLKDVVVRLDEFCTNTEIEEVVLKRIQSPEFLTLVRETFRAWDEASTLEKRDKFKKLITKAAAIELCSDDKVRIFIKWIAQYHEYHLSIIAAVHHNPGISLGAIWDNVFAQGKGRPRENSSEADLYRTLIRDLQLGGVIRQQREVSPEGEFYKKSTRGKSSSSQSSFMKSSFDDDDEMELSELGSEFVHYVLDELVPRISEKTD